MPKNAIHQPIRISGSTDISKAILEMASLPSAELALECVKCFAAYAKRPMYVNISGCTFYTKPNTTTIEVNNADQ